MNNQNGQQGPIGDAQQQMPAPNFAPTSHGDAAAMQGLQGFNPNQRQTGPNDAAHASAIPEIGADGGPVQQNNTGGFTAAQLAQADPSMVMPGQPMPGGQQIVMPGQPQFQQPMQQQPPIQGYPQQQPAQQQFTQPPVTPNVQGQQPIVQPVQPLQPGQATAQVLAKGVYAGQPGTPPMMTTPPGQDTANGMNAPSDKLKKKKDEDDEDEEDKDDMDYKSLTAGDLNKAAKLVQNLSTSTEEEPDERAQLAKGFAEGTLTDGESMRLQELLGYELPDFDGDTLGKSFAEMTQDDPLVKGEDFSDEDGTDVAGWISRIAQFMGSGLDVMGQRMEKGFSELGSNDLIKAQGMLMVSMAQRMAAQDELLKAMATDIVIMANTANPRRSTPTANVLNKAMFHGTGHGQQAEGPYHGLNMGEVQQGLRKLGHDNPNMIAPCGENITMATTQVECGQPLSKSLAGDIRNALGKAAG